MAVNLKEITGFIMPLVQSGKEEEAQNLLGLAVKTPSAAKGSSGKGGLLDVVSGSLGSGLIGNVGNLLGGGSTSPVSGLAAVLPSLLKLIQPEHLVAATNYMTGLVKKDKKSPAKKPAAKKTTTAGKANVNKTTTAKKPVTAKKAAPVKKLTAPKSTTVKKSAPTKKTTGTTSRSGK